MAARKPTTDAGLEQTIEEATVALIQSDPELRSELRDLISTAVARFKHDLTWGAPEVRIRAQNAIVPGLLRNMGKVEQSEQDAEMAAAYERLRTGGG